LRLPAQKAFQAILESPTPARVVQSLAEEDFFWIVREVGPEDALPLVALASNEQWQYLLDLELWKKDRLDIDAVHQWFSLLLKADPERFLIWGLRENAPLLELHLFKHIQIHVKEQDESPSDFEEGFFTLDGTFYIRIREKKYYEVLKGFLERLAAYDLQAFRNLLLESIGVLPAEVEEGLYRLRNVRLTEKGFLPFEEAIGVYQHLAPEKLKGERVKTWKGTDSAAASHPAPLSTALLIPHQDLFSLCLEDIEEGSTLERIRGEFAGLCNQIISADSFAVRNREDLAAVVRKACGYLDVGLQRLDGANPERGAQLVAQYLLNQIFRVGYGAGLELKWRAEKWLRKSWFAAQGLSPAFWGDLWAAVLEGLLRKRPLFCKGLSQGELCREFQDLSDIAYCREALDHMETMDRLLALALGDCRLAFQERYVPVRWANLLLTAWARDHLGLSQTVLPIRTDELRAFFQDLWAEKERPFHMKESMKHAFWTWLMVRTGLEVRTLQQEAAPPLDHLLKEVEREYGSVSPDDLDPRYVRHFLVARQGAMIP
jgi:hypothetical protein